MFKSSVCSYPDRGPYGDSKYRGNCTGFIIKDFYESYARKPNGLIADPSIGGGTSQDVANELNLRFKGTDLHQGFNLLRNDLLTFLGEPAHLIWWHPPYWNMITYSGEQWGQPNKWDMSRFDLPGFIEALEIAIMNIHDACEIGGHYGILMGNLRRNGEYYNLSSLVERLAPGTLVDEIIKIQHNCVSDKSEYANNGTLVRIAHEKLLVFRRNKEHSSISLLPSAQHRSKKMMQTVWKAAIRRLLQNRPMTESELLDAFEPWVQGKMPSNWPVAVKSYLSTSQFFSRTTGGQYYLAE